jgi:hypothetical protein
MLAPGHDEATHENGINPEDERLMQWTPNTIAPAMPMGLTKPEVGRVYTEGFSSLLLT